MKTLFLVVILISVLALPALAYDWVTSPINGHRYTLIDSDWWWEAEAQAVAMGGHLATIRNEAENQWIYDFALANKADCYRVWIGINAVRLATGPAPAYGYQWTSGELVTFTKWFTYNGLPEDYWRNYDVGGFMYIRYWSTSGDEKVEWWRAENEYSMRDNPVYQTGIVEVVPEPSSLVALSALLVPLLALRRRR